MKSREGGVLLGRRLEKGGIPSPELKGVTGGDYHGKGKARLSDIEERGVI